MTNTMVIINGVETAYYSDEPYSNPVFIGVPVAQSVDLCVVFCGPLLFTKHHTNLHIDQQEHQ
jgi:hypothetical protein